MECATSTTDHTTCGGTSPTGHSLATQRSLAGSPLCSTVVTSSLRQCRPHLFARPARSVPIQTAARRHPSSSQRQWQAVVALSSTRTTPPTNSPLRHLPSMALPSPAMSSRSTAMASSLKHSRAVRLPSATARKRLARTASSSLSRPLWATAPTKPAPRPSSSLHLPAAPSILPCSKMMPAVSLAQATTPSG